MGFRVVIPQRQREKLLQELHQDHPGVTRMKSVARSYMWWPGLDKEIENLAKSCSACQAVKRAPPVAPLHPWVWPSKPLQRVNLDFAGPFGLCRSIPRIQLLSCSGCILEMAGGTRDVHYKRPSYIGCLERVVLYSWHSGADRDGQWLPVYGGRLSRPSQRATEFVT